MRTYTCTVTFTDPRTKPRVVIVTDAACRKSARRAARAMLAEQQPTWEIDTVTASHGAEAPAGAKKAGTVKGKKVAKTRTPASPIKQAAGAAAIKKHGLLNDLDAEGKAAWWVTYRKHTAKARKAAAAKAAKVPATA